MLLSLAFPLLLLVLFVFTALCTGIGILYSKPKRQWRCCSLKLESSSSSNSNSEQQQVAIGRGGEEDMVGRRLREAKIEFLSAPLLDKDLLMRTIEDWRRPLPLDYLVKPLVLVGPSGVGKGRLVRSLMKDYAKFFKKVVTHTTRAPRVDETNGTSYHFVSNSSFFDLVEQKNTFIEWSPVHDHYYGISEQAWQSVAEGEKKIAILEIDICGARTIKKVAKARGWSPIFVFVSPTNIEMLRERLALRGTETQAQIELRVTNARRELSECTEPGLFDRNLVNDDFEQTVRSFFRLARDYYPALPSAARIRMLQRRIAKIKELSSSSSSSSSPSLSSNNVSSSNEVVMVKEEDEDEEEEGEAE